MALTRSLRALLVFVCVLVLVDTMFFTALTPLLPHYTQVAHLSKSSAGILAWAWVLVPVLIAGMPFFGTLFTPAMTLVSEGAQGRGLDQGLAFGLANLAWVAGQAAAASGSGALAQATSDLVPYSLLAAVCLATLGFVRVRRPALEAAD